MRSCLKQGERCEPTPEIVLMWLWHAHSHTHTYAQKHTKIIVSIIKSISLTINIQTSYSIKKSVTIFLPALTVIHFMC